MKYGFEFFCLGLMLANAAIAGDRDVEMRYAEKLKLATGPADAKSALCVANEHQTVVYLDLRDSKLPGEFKSVGVYFEHLSDFETGNWTWGYRYVKDLASAKKVNAFDSYDLIQSGENSVKGLDLRTQDYRKGLLVYQPNGTGQPVNYYCDFLQSEPTKQAILDRRYRFDDGSEFGISEKIRWPALWPYMTVYNAYKVGKDFTVYKDRMRFLLVKGEGAASSIQGYWECRDAGTVRMGDNVHWGCAGPGVRWGMGGFSAILDDGSDFRGDLSSFEDEKAQHRKTLAFQKVVNGKERVAKELKTQGFERVHSRRWPNLFRNGSDFYFLDTNQKPQKLFLRSDGNYDYGVKGNLNMKVTKQVHYSQKWDGR